MNILESIEINLDEILSDLEYNWKSHKDYNYNRTAFMKKKISGENTMMCCPFHSESNPSFGIKSNYPFTWQCFGCGLSGNLIHLIKHALSLPTDVHAEHYLTKNYVDVSAESRPTLDIDKILDGKQVSKTTHNIEDYIGKRHSYMYSRGFIERTLSKYEIGFNESNQSIVIPVRTSNGDVRFLKQRSVNSRIFLNEEGIYKKDILYGLFYLKEAMGKVPKVYITESETDTMACYQAGLPSVSLMGRILFKEQVSELLKAGVEEVILFLDNDEKGQEAIDKVYEQLSTTPIKVFIVKYPTHLGIDTHNPDTILNKDANDLLKSKQINKIEIISYEEFYMLKNGRKLYGKKF